MTKQNFILLLVLCTILHLGLKGVNVYASTTTSDSVSQVEFEVWEVVLERYYKDKGFRLSNLTMKVDSLTISTDSYRIREIDKPLLQNFHAQNKKSAQIPERFVGYKWFRFYDFYADKLYEQQSVVLDSAIKMRNKKNDFLRRLQESRVQIWLRNNEQVLRERISPQIHLSRVGFDSSTATAIVCIKILGSISFGTNCEMGRQSNTTEKDFKNFITTRSGNESTFLLQKRLGIWQILNQWGRDITIKE